ncbi:MAG: hypothetical protein HY872_08875 [Chloroflexi bacterium]|nr:hypothetical protein [Chloroflexota bacterium]
MKSANLQNILVFATGVALLIIVAAFLVFLTLYLWYALRDILVVIRNYNLRPAKRCHWTSCGFYHHDEDDPQTKDCLNPLVGPAFFDALSREGNQPGCHYSIQVREIDVQRKLATDYRKEFLETYTAFSVYSTWWKVVTVLAGVLLLYFGVFNLAEALKTIFG